MAGFELHLTRDSASWRYGERTACLGQYPDRAAAVDALNCALSERPHCLAAYEIREVRPSHYYDLPKSELQVSEDEALFDRILDDCEADAFWMLDAMREGWTLPEIKRDGLRSWVKRSLVARKVAA